MNSPHIPVLLNEVLDTFSHFDSIDKPILLDCTLGFGGHSAALLQRYKALKIIACDQDDQALDFCKKRFKAELENGRITLYKSNFASILEHIKGAKISGILADIGVSSLQLDSSERGFSLGADSLDMRMDKTAPKSAKEIVNEYSTGELERIFSEFGELKMSAKIAAKITAARAKSPINTAKELAAIIGDERIKGRNVSIAKLVFQALRIEVNDELGVLKSLLSSLKSLRPSGARVAIIDFHSLEDRIIKESFRAWSNGCVCDPAAMRCACGGGHALGKIITKKPITPTSAEMRANPRSSCAKMRIFEFK